MVTSAVPQEGKTLTVVNLALTLSESYGRRVLLIDADLRWPSVHELLDVPCDAGLSQALASTRRALPIVDVTPRLSVLPAGQPEPNPLAGLSSERMPAMLDEVQHRFDWVLLDSPPVGHPARRPVARPPRAGRRVRDRRRIRRRFRSSSGRSSTWVGTASSAPS